VVRDAGVDALRLVVKLLIPSSVLGCCQDRSCRAREACFSVVNIVLRWNLIISVIKQAVKYSALLCKEIKVVVDKNRVGISTRLKSGKLVGTSRVVIVAFLEELIRVENHSAAMPVSHPWQI
jgi:hypothetical protein